MFLSVWLGATVLFCFSTVAQNGNNDNRLKIQITNQLSNKADPLLTFGLSCYDMCRQSRYESVLLQESNMTPLPPPASPRLPPAPLAARPNIIFLMVESFRHDLLDKVWQEHEITPNINRMAREGTHFTSAYAASSHTSLSNTSIPSSLYPFRQELKASYRADDPYPKMLIHDILKPYGYSTAWISSDIEEWSGMASFLRTPALDLLVDAASREFSKTENGRKTGEKIQVQIVPDRITADTAMQWMDEHMRDGQPFYAMISFKDSHFPYESSVGTRLFQPAEIPDGYTFCNYPKENTEKVYNTYANAIHGIDGLIGEIFAFLRNKGVDKNTIVVLLGDHGEAFYENGLASHASLPYETTVHTGLIMWGPRWFEARKEPYPTSLIDAVPTILARIGVPPHPNFQGINVLSPQRPDVASRCLYIHCDALTTSEAVLAGGRWKYFEHDERGTAYLFDLQNDPGELHNMADAEPAIAGTLQALLDQWRTRQLAYYRSSRYYKRFYPPPPPILTTTSDAPAAVADDQAK